ncbi:uncharacterized protein LOC109794701 isoform X2 [Cajanus cajan]|uniref:uncharacterized protein LOC109794701 isoform X2 n=1 Tax=Cajanus cajan TaxID=3821 RepID=UPI00098DB6DE|nr:uncharacterized protein LOC109794701 isoform X2 [Cajanus cajan]
MIEDKMKGEERVQNAKRKWVLAAIILLALCSIFTASLTLKCSPANLTPHSDSTTLHDFDVLEVEEREKVVRRMWDVYTQTKTALPRFWSHAFHAAYHHLLTHDPTVRDAAVTEIAKMSLRSLNLHLAPPISNHNPQLWRTHQGINKNEATRE